MSVGGPRPGQIRRRGASAATDTSTSQPSWVRPRGQIPGLPLTGYAALIGRGLGSAQPPEAPRGAHVARPWEGMGKGLGEGWTPSARGFWALGWEGCVVCGSAMQPRPAPGQRGGSGRGARRGEPGGLRGAALPPVLSGMRAGTQRRGCLLRGLLASRAVGGPAPRPGTCMLPPVPTGLPRSCVTSGSHLTPLCLHVPVGQVGTVKKQRVPVLRL